MEKIEQMLAKSADSLSAGELKDAYLCYLDIIVAVVNELRNVRFIKNVAIPSPSTVSLIAISRTSVAHVQEILSRNNPDIAAISERPPPISRKQSLARHADRIQAGQVKTVATLTEQLQQMAGGTSSDPNNSPDSPYLSRASSFSSNASPSPFTSPNPNRMSVTPPKPIRKLPPVHKSPVLGGVSEMLGSSPSASTISIPSSTSSSIPSGAAAATVVATTTTATTAALTPATTPAPTSTPAPTLAPAPAPAPAPVPVPTPAPTPAPAPAPASAPVATAITPASTTRTPPTRPIPPINSPTLQPQQLQPPPPQQQQQHQQQQQSNPTPRQSPVPPSIPQFPHQQSLSGTESPPRSKPPLPPKPARLYRNLDETLEAQADEQTEDEDDSDSDDDDAEDPSHLAVYSGGLSRRASSPSIAIPQPARRPGTPLSVPNSPTLSPSSLSSAISSADRSQSFTLPQFSGPGPSGSLISVIPDGSVDPTNLVEAKRGDDEDQFGHKTYGPFDHIPMIPVSPLCTTERTLKEKKETWEIKLRETEQQLKDFEEKAHSGSGEATMEDVHIVKDFIDKYESMRDNIQITIDKIQILYVRSESIASILEFPAYLVAYQLTLIESAIFLEIPPSALLTHSPKTPHRAITASTDFFNYLTRLIEYSVLSPPEAFGRAQCIHYWVKLAVKLHELGNFQTLKAVLSALGTPPIKRLKRTWSFLPRKSAHKLETLQDLMSESRNYGKYREMMNSIMGGAMALSPAVVSPIHSLSMSSSSSTTTSKLDILGNVSSSFGFRSKEVAARRPMVPFLGTFIMDITYLLAAVKKSNSNLPPISAQIPATSSLRDSPSINTQFAPEDDPRIRGLLDTLTAYQNGPKYPPQPPRQYIKAATKGHHHFRAPSLSSALHRTAKYRTSSADRQIGANITHQSSYDDDDDDIAGSGLRSIQQLILHYLLTRPWVPERTVDELSMAREPPKNKNSSSSSSSTSSTRASGSGVGATGSTGSWVSLGVPSSSTGSGSLYSSTTSTTQRGSTGSGGSSRPTSIDE